VVGLAAAASVIAWTSWAAGGPVGQPYHGAGRFKMSVMRSCGGLPDLSGEVTLDIVKDRVRLDVTGIPLLTGAVKGARFEVLDSSGIFEIRGTFTEGTTQRATLLLHLPDCTGRGDVTIDQLEPPIAVLVPSPLPSSSVTASPRGGSVGPSASVTPASSASSAPSAPSAETSSTAPFVVAIVVGVVLMVVGIGLLIAYRRSLPTIEEVARAVIESDGGSAGRKGKSKELSASAR